MQKWKNEWFCQRIHTYNGRIQIGWVANVLLFLHPQYFKGQFLNLPPFIRIDRLVRLALRNSQICICSYSWGHILSPAVSIWRSLHEKANSRTPLWNICLYSYLPTVFPRIVSAETILFWIWPYVLWPLITVHKSAETIQGRKLFKGGNYMRKYGIPIICISDCGKLKQTFGQAAGQPTTTGQVSSI